MGGRAVKLAKFVGAMGAALAMVAILATGVFAADPFASAISTSTSTTVADYTSILNDVIPVLLGIAVITLLAKRGLRLFGR
jgi:uncharacterized membrane protein